MPGNEILLSATISEDMLIGSNMNVTLNSGAVVQLSRNASTANLYTGTYLVAPEDTDVADLAVTTFSLKLFYLLLF